MNRPYVRLLLPDAYNPHEQFQAEAARLAADRLGAGLSVDFARADFGLQVQQILRSAFHGEDRPDAIVVMPVRESALKAISGIVASSGIGWMCLNRDPGNLEEIRRAHPGVPVCFISPDQWEIGRIHAHQLRRLFPRGARVLYVHGSGQTSSARERRSGLKDALARSGDPIDIVAEVDGHWTATDAQRAVTDVLPVLAKTKASIDVVVCQSDYMAAGVLEALRAAAATGDAPFAPGMPVIGCDGLKSVGQRLVDTGKLAATVIAPTTADRAVETVVAWHRGDMKEVPPRILIPPRAYPEEASLAPWSGSPPMIGS